MLALTADPEAISNWKLLAHKNSDISRCHWENQLLFSVGGKPIVDGQQNMNSTTSLEAVCLTLS